MAIIISKNGKNAKKIEKVPITKEGYLQKYIYDNPESIPLYDFKEDVRLLILAREFPTTSGPIDAIGIDEDGEIYLVETKLYKNPDKRLVVAQVLDYGASLWRSYGPEDFVRTLEKETGDAFKMTLMEKIVDFYGLEDENIAGVIDNLKNNVKDGKFKFVILMDKLQSKLKDLILFINENSRFDILAVEMEYYKHEDYEVMIPKLFGAEIKKPPLSPEWDEGKFFTAATEKIGQNENLKKVQELFNFARDNSILDWGRGVESGTFTFKIKHPKSKSGIVSIFTVYTNGSIRFRFGNIGRTLGEHEAKLFFDKLKALPVAEHWVKEEVIKVFGPKVPIQEAFPNEKAVELFKSAILSFLAEIK